MKRFEVVPARPYSLARTIGRFARFPDAVDLADRTGTGSFRRLLPVRPAAVLLVEQRGSPWNAVLQVSLEGPGAAAPAARREAQRVLDRALGASTDVRPFEKRFRHDALLGPAIRRFRGLRVAGAPTVWEALVGAVLAQQINLAFAASIRTELVHAFGRRARIGEALYFAFPTPEAIARAGARGLAGFRLSRAKRDTLLRLARGFAGGSLTEDALGGLTDEEVIARLTRIRGVGRWTAEVALLRGLGRRDAFPAGDLSIVKYLAVGLLGRTVAATEREMREHSDRWKPYRSLALVYLYAALADAEARREKA